MKAMSSSDFGKFVMGIAKDAKRAKPFEPTVHYDPDGDCIEFLTKPDSFYAERIDDLVTVYYSHETNEVIGSLIKGVSEFCENIVKRCPGFAIEIRDGRVHLAHLFLAQLWTCPNKDDQIMSAVYEKLIADAESAQAEVEMSPA